MSVSVSVPEDLYNNAAEFAAAENVSVDEVFASAFAEKWLRGNDCDSERRGNREDFLRVLEQVPDVEPDGGLEFFLKVR